MFTLLRCSITLMILCATLFTQSSTAAHALAPLDHRTPTGTLAQMGDENWDPRFGFPGVSYLVNAIVQDGNDLYVAGFFSEAGGVEANNIVRWDGARWHTLGAGLDREVVAMAMVGDHLYVAGQFDSAGGINAKGLARWDGSAWSPVTISGFQDEFGNDGQVYELATDGTHLYVGGAFATVDGVAARNIARWDGSTWTGFGEGVGEAFEGEPISGGEVRTILPLGSTLYVGGSFNRAGSVTALNVARWDGSAWSDLGLGVGDQDFEGNLAYGTVYALAAAGSTLYVGGNFDHAGTLAVNSIARWDGSSWSALGNGVLDTGLSDVGTVNALAVVGSTLYAGGNFNQAGTTPIQHLAQWDGATWAAVGGSITDDGYGPVFSLLSDGAGGLYVGGEFDTAGGLFVRSIAHWTGSIWGAFGQGPTYSSISARIYAIAVAPNGDVYAGGDFNTVGGKPANNIARWDGTTWTALGDGTNDVVRALAINGTDVYVGGDFNQVGTISANHIARWDSATSQWSALSSGINGTVYALAVGGNTLYAGGNFTAAGSTSTQDLARWDGTGWSKFGAGIDFMSAFPQVRALAVSGSVVAIGGDFSDVRLPGTTTSLTVNGLLLWNSSDDSWYRMGSGITRQSSGTDIVGTVNTLAIIDTNIYVGGDFDKAGGVSAGAIARWDAATSQWAALGDSVAGPYRQIYALAVNGTDLYVGGAFTAAGTTPASHIAVWDSTTSTWAPLGSGLWSDSLYGEVQSLAMSPAGLYVGGFFDTAGGHPAASFARWIITTAPCSIPDVDLNNDGATTIIDIQLAAGSFGAAGSALPGDVDCNGTVEVDDISTVAMHW